ncbi:ATP-grasp domain-containing protein [Roseimaritima ulvae]|nr:hypothetical protein [Roseimaritima ulvae]
MSNVSALIIGSGYNAHGLARSLHAVGVPCYGFDDSAAPLLEKSRLFHDRQLVSSALTFEAKRAALLTWVEQLPNPVVLFPTDERWLVDCLEHSDRYQRAGVVIPCANPQAALLCADKTRFKQWCQQQRVCTAKAIGYGKGDSWPAYQRVVEGMSFPIVVKPTTKGDNQTALGFSFYELFETVPDFLAWADARGSQGPSCDILAEEFIAGPVTSLVSLQGYVDRGGNILASQYRKLSQTEGFLGCGNVAQIEACDAELLRLTKSILGKLGFHGFFDIEFKLSGPRNTPYLIEINPRACMLNFAATRMGCNLPAAAISDMCPELKLELPDVSIPSEPWVWCRHLPHLVDSLRATASVRPVLWASGFAKHWWQPLAGKRRNDPMLMWRDVSPYRNLCGYLLGKALRKCLQKCFRLRAAAKPGNGHRPGEGRPVATLQASSTNRAA